MDIESLRKRITTHDYDESGDLSDDINKLAAMGEGYLKQLTTLQAEKEALETECGELKAEAKAEKERLEGELGRLRDEKMALIAEVNGCKDGARQGFMEFKAEVDAAEGEAEQYRGLLQLLVDWDKQWPTSRTYNVEQFNRLENKLTEIIEKIKAAFKEHPTQEPTNGS